MRTHNSRIIPVFLCLLCLLALLPAPVRAAGPIDPTQEVCLTIHYQHDRQPVSGVPFDLFYVASVDAYGEFTLTGDFAGYPVRLTGLDSDGWGGGGGGRGAGGAFDRWPRMPPPTV